MSQGNGQSAKDARTPGRMSGYVSFGSFSDDLILRRLKTPPGLAQQVTSDVICLQVQRVPCMGLFKK